MDNFQESIETKATIIRQLIKSKRLKPIYDYNSVELVMNYWDNDKSDMLYNIEMDCE